jgi:hypothetical protein
LNGTANLFGLWTVSTTVAACSALILVFRQTASGRLTCFSSFWTTDS